MIMPIVPRWLGILVAAVVAPFALCIGGALLYALGYGWWACVKALWILCGVFFGWNNWSDL